MGFFDFLGGGKDPIQRIVARMSNKYVPTDARNEAMRQLAKLGTEDALVGLCKRFNFRVDKTIDDEQEKSYASQLLTAAGGRAIPALRRYMKEAESISWALRVLDKIASGGAAHAELLAAIDDLLEREPPGYARDPGRKMEVISFLSELAHLPKSEAARRIVPYLADFDQNVRAHAVDALSLVPDEGAARLPLIAAMIRPEEEVKRIRVRCAEVLAAEGWPVTESLEQARAVIASLAGFSMVGDKIKKGA
jgi:hypothetical protein